MVQIIQNQPKGDYGVENPPPGIFSGGLGFEKLAVEIGRAVEWGDFSHGQSKLP